MIKSGELIKDNYSLIELPIRYKSTSQTGEVAVIKNDKDCVIIEFWTLRGLSVGESNSFIYTSTDYYPEDDLYKDGYKTDTYRNMAEHWYFAVLN